MSGRDDLVPLTYAGPLAQYGVVVLPEGQNLRIILPPTPTGQRIVLGVGALLLGFPLLAVFMSHHRPSWVGTGSSLAFWLAILAITFRRLGRPTVVQITPKTFRIDRPVSFMGEARHPQIQRMPTAKIYRVYYYADSRAIFIRGHGEEMLELPCPYGGPAGEELVMLIQQYLNLPDPNLDQASPQNARGVTPNYE